MFMADQDLLFFDGVANSPFEQSFAKRFIDNRPLLKRMALMA